jgi:hypothetical protein
MRLPKLVRQLNKQNIRLVNKSHVMKCQQSFDSADPFGNAPVELDQSSAASKRIPFVNHVAALVKQEREIGLSQETIGHFIEVPSIRTQRDGRDGHWVEIGMKLRQPLKDPGRAPGTVDVRMSL